MLGNYLSLPSFGQWLSSLSSLKHTFIQVSPTLSPNLRDSTVRLIRLYMGCPAVDGDDWLYKPLIRSIRIAAMQLELLPHPPFMQKVRTLLDSIENYVHQKHFLVGVATLPMFGSSQWCNHSWCSNGRQIILACSTAGCAHIHYHPKCCALSRPCASFCLLSCIEGFMAVEREA